jgi:hypothetical protein
MKVRARGATGRRAAKACRAFVVGREAFARISEADGIRLSDEMKNAFAEFDAQGLSHAERRRAIISRFKKGCG